MSTQPQRTPTSPQEDPELLQMAALPYERPQRWDLFGRFPGLKRFVRWRSFPFILILPNVIIFYILLLAGGFGSPIGNANIIIVFVWILWWFLLISAMVPLASRLWCTMCPLPFVGDWLQRRTLYRVRTGDTAGTRNQMFGLNLRWPRKLSNIWLQNFGFLALASISTLLVTRPIVSTVVLGTMIGVAAVMALIWRQRAFCNYVCPISGFLSLYAMTAKVELRSNPDVCARCRHKSCVRGSEKGWACPWFIYMGRLDRNNYCGLCMECVKSCPYDNISLYLRPFASDTRLKGVDEVWKAFIMLVLAGAYTVVLQGPWGFLKDWANISEVGNWPGFLTYVGSMWSAALLGFPAVYGLSLWLGRRWAGETEEGFKGMFVRYAYPLVPLGLLAWIAFSVPLMFINGSYIIRVISDPAGLGWNLFGTANFPWVPLIPEYMGWIQIPLLLYGLYVALQKGLQIAGEFYSEARAAWRSFLPLAVLLTLVTLGFLRLFIG